MSCCLRVRGETSRKLFAAMVEVGLRMRLLVRREADWNISRCGPVVRECRRAFVGEVEMQGWLKAGKECRSSLGVGSCKIGVLG